MLSAEDSGGSSGGHMKHLCMQETLTGGMQIVVSQYGGIWVFMLIHLYGEGKPMVLALFSYLGRT